VWTIDERQEAELAKRTTPYWGSERAAPDDRVWVQKLVHGEEWDDDREHLRRAYQLSLRPAISSCDHILQVLDLIEPYDTYLISEAAETDLDRALRAGSVGSDDHDELAAALRDTLDVLHAEGLVHCDVREDNVFRVSGHWKLGDLGGVVEIGSPIVALPKNPAYIPEGVDFKSPAEPEIDSFQLGVVLDRIRRGLG
jgi:hypothetical protein